MTIDNQQVQDPSKQGTSGLKGLEGINRLKSKGIDIDTSIFNLADNYRDTMSEINQTASPKQNIGFVGVGDSMYEKDITSASQLDNLPNTRGELHPWYAQLGAGVAKGVILTGTTFLDGTLGLLAGITNAITEQRVSALWDNPISKALQSVNEWSEQALPNYYTDNERKGVFSNGEINWDNLFSSNFIDSIYRRATVRGVFKSCEIFESILLMDISFFL